MKLGDELAKALHLTIYSARSTDDREEAQMVHRCVGDVEGSKRVDEVGLGPRRYREFPRGVSSILRYVYHNRIPNTPLFLVVACGAAA
jgi:hypothetical protein